MAGILITDASTDCFNEDGELYEGTNYLYVGGSTVSGDYVDTWIPFVVPLPPMTIISATLYVTASAGGNSDIDIKLVAEKINNSVKPTSLATLTGKVSTTANIYPVTAPSSGGVQYSYNVTSIVQEVLNISGWANGNTLGMMFRTMYSADTKRCEIASSEHATYSEPVLIIYYADFIPTVMEVT